MQGGKTTKRKANKKKKPAFPRASEIVEHNGVEPMTSCMPCKVLKMLLYIVLQFVTFLNIFELCDN